MNCIKCGTQLEEGMRECPVCKTVVSEGTFPEKHHEADREEKQDVKKESCVRVKEKYSAKWILYSILVYIVVGVAAGNLIRMASEPETKSEGTLQQMAAVDTKSYLTKGRYHLRTEPSASSEILKTMDDHTTCFGTGNVSEDGKWTEIRTEEGLQGWISSEGLRMQ